MIDLGLINLIGKKHGKGPRTHTRSKDAPIDCIFGTADFKILRGGYLSFRILASDHRGLWIDIPYFILYSYNPPQPVFHMARRLKLTDPRVVARYLEYLHCAKKDNDFFNRMDVLHKSTVYPLPQHLKDDYEAIDILVYTYG